MSVKLKSYLCRRPKLHNRRCASTGAGVCRRRVVAMTFLCWYAVSFPQTNVDNSGLTHTRCLEAVEGWGVVEGHGRVGEGGECGGGGVREGRGMSG